MTLFHSTRVWAGLVASVALPLSLLSGCAAGTSNSGTTASEVVSNSDDAKGSDSTGTGTGTGSKADAGTSGDGATAAFNFSSDGGNAGDGGGACDNPLNLEGCSCNVGQTQKCFLGDPTKAGIGTCTFGTQSCQKNGEFATWSACTGSGAPLPAACDGKDNLCTGGPDPGCGCVVGTTQSCYDGPTGTEGVGTCTGGTQTCTATATGSAWSACAGEVTPASAEVCGDQLDHNCDGKKGCDDSQCASTTACIQEETTYCNSGGSVYVDNVSYSGSVNSYAAYLCSGTGNGSTCSSTLGTGGTFSEHCAGTYKVCARVVASPNSCTIDETCVNVTIPTPDATVALPAFPGFGFTTSACVDSTYPSGSMSTSIDVTGTTTTGIAVNRPNVATGIDREYWGGGGGSGSGGGSF